MIRPLLGDKYKSENEFYAPNNHDWATTPIYKQHVQKRPLTESLRGQVLTVNFVSTIKKNKLELKLKRKGKHNAYERHLLNTSVKALLVQAVEAAYRTKLSETEVEY